MDRAMLIYKTADLAGSSIAQTERIISAMLTIMTEAFAAGESVEPDPNFGRFISKKREGDPPTDSPRSARNPYYVVVFKAGNGLRKKLKILQTPEDCDQNRQRPDDICSQRVEALSRCFSLQSRMLTSLTQSGDILPSRSYVLNTLQEHGRVQAESLMKELNLKQIDGAEFIERLICENFIERIYDVKDQMKAYIQLSPAGYQLLEEEEKIMKEGFARYVSKLTEAEYNNFLDAMAVMLELFLKTETRE